MSAPKDCRCFAYLASKAPSQVPKVCASLNPAGGELHYGQRVCDDCAHDEACHTAREEERPC